MKYKYLMMISFLAVLGNSELVAAHEVPGALGSKRTAASASDIYLVNCPGSATAQIAISVKDLTPTRPKYRRQNQKYWNPSLVSIQAVDTISGAVSAVSTDPRGGTIKCRAVEDSDSCFSPEIALVAGPGPYQLIVTKSASRIRGSVIYKADAHCLDINDNHTNYEEISITQNQ